MPRAKHTDVAANVDSGLLELVPLAEAERMTSVSRNTLLGEIRDGRLSACRVRGRWYVTRGQIAAWLKRIEVAANDS